MFIPCVITLQKTLSLFVCQDFYDAPIQLIVFRHVDICADVLFNIRKEICSNDEKSYTENSTSCIQKPC